MASRLLNPGVTLDRSWMFGPSFAYLHRSVDAVQARFSVRFRYATADCQPGIANRKSLLGHRLSLGGDGGDGERPPDELGLVVDSLL